MTVLSNTEVFFLIRLVLPEISSFIQPNKQSNKQTNKQILQVYNISKSFYSIYYLFNSNPKRSNEQHNELQHYIINYYVFFFKCEFFGVPKIGYLRLRLDQ